MSFLLPALALIILPLMISLLPVRVLRSSWSYPLFFLPTSLLGWMVSANAYHVRNAYEGLPETMDSGFFLVGVVWTVVFSLPSLLVVRALSKREQKEFRYDVTRGLIGAGVTALFLVWPSFLLSVILSLE